jgi:hypothetical protein
MADMPVTATVRVGLDRTGYEIDLNAEHAQALRGCAGATCGQRGGPEAVRGGLPGAGAGHGPMRPAPLRSASGPRRRASG